MNFDTGHLEGLRSTLDAQISHWEQIYGSDPSELDYGQRFYGVIRRAYESTGEKVAILIDEYDKPLFSTIDRPELNNRFREILKSVYGTLKAADRYIRFALVTGVTRFSRLSIFSDINNLRDISLSYDYAAVCGITEEEMLANCRDGIECFASANSISYEEAFRKLKDNYDGYHYAAVSPDIYNPFSLFNALTEYKIKEYWFSTGTPTFLFKILREQRSDLKDLFDINVREKSLSERDTYSSNPLPLLFQTGYLTIKGYDSSTDELRLGIPNREVESGLFDGLLPIFSGTSSFESEEAIRKFSTDLYRGDADEFMERLQGFLADIPYDLSRNKPEVYFENNLYIIARLLGYEAHTEYRTSRGRIDLLIIVPAYVYVIELKLDGTAEEALAQIESRGYSLPWQADGREVILIGVNFSGSTRNIDRWIIRQR